MYISWGAVIAGAIAASARTFVRITFGAAIGLAVASPSASWHEDASGARLVVGNSRFCSSAVAKLCARRRSRRFGCGRPGDTTTADEVEFRDGIDGVLVWGLAILIGASLALGASARSSAAGHGQRPRAKALQPLEPLLAFEARPAVLVRHRRPTDAVEPVYPRAGGADHHHQLRTRRHWPPRIAPYLVRMVMTRTGLAQPDAEAPREAK